MLRLCAYNRRLLVAESWRTTQRGTVCRNASWLSWFKWKKSVPLPEFARKDHVKEEVIITQHIPPTTKYPNWNYNVELTAFCHRLLFPAKEKALLQQALTHPSFQDVPNQEDAVHNEQLASFGKAATHYFLSEHIYLTFPNLPGEGIKALTHYLTLPDSLALTAIHLGTLELIRSSSKAAITELDVLPLSNVFYALVGAIYHAQGMVCARKFVCDFVVARLQEQDLFDVIKLDQPKVMLRRLLQHQQKPAPVSRLLHEASRNSPHAVFWAGVYCGRTLIGKGTGMSLNKAEEEACRDALRKHFLTELHNAPMPSLAISKA